MGLGCDRLDPSLLMPKDRAATGVETAGMPLPEGRPDAPIAEAQGDAREEADGNRASAPLAKRAPDMESIGPEGSQRIYYQFVDDRGRVQFVERLSDVPNAWRDRVGYVEMSQPPPLTPLEARRTWKLSAGETAEILLAKGANRRTGRAGGRQSSDVILYSASWCGYCTQARKHLDREGVDYELRDVDNDSIARELREKTGRGGVPVLDYDGEIVRGYSKGHYDKAIRAIRS
jgi:glutaredoxin